MTTNEKVSIIRNEMKLKGLDAYIIPSTDPHISEYVPEHWSSRSFVSGFNGSAGTVVITQSVAGVWTDGRYFLQAEQQLADSEFKLFRLGNDGVDDYPEWLCKNLKDGNVVGFDANVFQINLVEGFKSKLNDYGININSDYDLIDSVWKDRPNLPRNVIFEHTIEYSGESTKSKLAKIREELKANNCNSTIVCTLDDICWTFNIRGNDVKFNPVCLAFAIITIDKATLYIYPEKVPHQISENLIALKVDMKDYSKFLTDVALLDKSNIYIDKARTNYNVLKSIKNTNKIISGVSISTKLKAVKNKIEINNIKNAMQRDGVALANFQFWLESTFAKGEELDELRAMAKLRACRAAQDKFYGESFNTIAGFAGNGAIIHYGADEHTNKKIDDSTFFLLDSGGQYLDGTTDITRVFHLGTPTDEEKTDYTNVLKGMIDLNIAKFPKGTRGSQLDVIARKALWDRYENYKHGTGHGVGCFMNVHEGPQSIRTEENSTKLEIGMICSNEPGIYRANKWGVRIENLIVVVEDKKSDFDTFYKFDNLTLYSIETKNVKKDLLNDIQLNWLNAYNNEVFEKLSPSLNDEIKSWLKEKTKAI